jgi:hypothetical protein
METIEETKTYDYQELEEDAKQKVREWWYEHGLWDRWYEDTYEDFKRDGYDLGFVIDKFSFTGFYSQGDGACWEGKVDVAQWLKTHTNDSIARDAWCALIQEEFCNKHFNIYTKNNHYSHSNTMTCVGWDWCDENGEEDYLYLKLPSIFQGMHYKDVRNLITSSDYIYKDPNDIEQAAFESAKEYADKLYKQLREEYEYLTSEESLIQSCEANDWRFDEEGDMV